jgi:hypothetical protein
MMRDDVKSGKVKLGKFARRYARMTSRQAMRPGWKAKAYINAVAELTNQPARGFANRDVGQYTDGLPLPRRKR